MKIVTALFLMLSGFTANADIRAYECSNRVGAKFTFTVDDGEGLPPERWDAEADDGRNPMNCYFYRFTAGEKLVFDCESYQGIRHGFLTVPKALPSRLKATFVYVHRDDGRVTRRYDGDCSLIIE